MRAVVTGGAGFLGRAICERLAARGDDVLSLSRGAHPELAGETGITHQAVDITDGSAVLAALEGADVVFHVAAKAGVWGPREDYFKTNVAGTRHVLAACIEHRIPRLVHTSSPSVCFDGSDHVRAGNDLVYPQRFLAAYPESKARAEALVLTAHGTRGLATCALRPHLIFGPRDPHLVPRLLDRARAGQLRIVGSGTNEVSMTYVDNAAHAHLCAADVLVPSAPHAGKAYFINQEEPVRLWEWMNDLLERLGEPRVTRRVPARVAYAAGGLFEAIYRGLRLSGEPRMTRFVAAQLASSHSYDMTPAKRDFGYTELVGMEEATERTVQDLVTGTR
jgi:2-alkyl-3-oxoalkanoate reductase